MAGGFPSLPVARHDSRDVGFFLMTLTALFFLKECKSNIGTPSKFFFRSKADIYHSSGIHIELKPNVNICFVVNMF